MFVNPDASEPNKKLTFFEKSIFFNSSNEICLIFLFLNLAVVAIRKNVNKLAKYSEYLKDLKLVDYKVRILNTGTEAVTRVSIESTDSQGKNWFTIGVSPNIIDASFKALIDSLDYKLFKDNAPASA